MNDILIGIPTYNEIENLPRLIQEIKLRQPNADILVVDDNSPDGTGRWCDEHAASIPTLRCMHRQSKQGIGTAVIAAMRDAMERDYRLFINMDADFSHHPHYLPSLIGQMERSDVPPADVVIASRYVRGGGVKGWPSYRKWMSWGVNQLSRTALGLRPRDCSGAFRCYRTSMLRRLNFATIRSCGYAFFEEVLWQLQNSGAVIREIPFLFADRTSGHTKISPREAANTLGTISLLGMKRILGASSTDRYR